MYKSSQRDRELMYIERTIDIERMKDRERKHWVERER
jgi:hypothetical protein